MRNIESWILSYLLNSMWQIPLLFAGGRVVARALKPAGAEAEHRAWVGVLLLQCLIPACSTLPWRWLSALFAWSGGGRGAGDAKISVAMGPGTGLNTLHLPPALFTFIAIAYFAVSAYFVLRFVWRWTKLSAMRRDAVEAALTGNAALCWAQDLKSFGIEEASIATSSRVGGPVTMGLRRKLLLMPAGMIVGLPDADLRTVFAHEFAHMRRNDFLKNLIYELLSLPASYHPLFRLTREQVMESREVVCDRMAARIVGRKEYARSLLRLASLLVEGAPIRVPHAIGIFDANAFERRLMKLTEKESEIRGARRSAIVFACAALAIATCGSAVALSLHVDAATAHNDSNPSNTDVPIAVSSEVMAGNKLTKVPPTYPVEAKKAKIQGTVVLDAVIGKDGSVEKLTVVSGPRELQDSSLDAVRQWTYKPFLLNGNPVEIKTTIKVVYSLAG